MNQIIPHRQTTTIHDHRLGRWLAHPYKGKVLVALVGALNDLLIAYLF